MTSVLLDIFDPSQLQCPPAVSGTTLAPPTPPAPRAPDDPMEDSDSQSHSPSDPGSDDEDPQIPSASHNSLSANAAFAINTARTLQLTADGENLLLQYSQVCSLPPQRHSCQVDNISKLDAMSAMVFQQGTLIKLSETLNRPTTTTQGPGAGNALAITSDIKVIFPASCD